MDSETDTGILSGMRNTPRYGCGARTGSPASSRTGFPKSSNWGRCWITAVTVSASISPALFTSTKEVGLWVSSCLICCQSEAFSPPTLTISSPAKNPAR